MVWVALCAAVVALVAAWVLADIGLFVLNEFLQCLGRADNSLRVLVEGLPIGVWLGVLLTSLAVLGGALAYRSPPPQWAQPGQDFEVVLGCDVVARSRMPSVAEQMQADLACYLVSFAAPITKDCKPVADHHTDQANCQTQRSSDAWIAQVVVFAHMLVLGFFIGYRR